MNFKAIRIQNRKLLDSYHGEACEICGNRQGTVAHHIQTKKSGGPDVAHNLVALCNLHHRQIHDVGINSFITLYPRFRSLLNRKGWEAIQNGTKVTWFNPEF